MVHDEQGRTRTAVPIWIFDAIKILIPLAIGFTTLYVKVELEAADVERVKGSIAELRITDKEHQAKIAEHDAVAMSIRRDVDVMQATLLAAIETVRHDIADMKAALTHKVQP